MMYSTHVIIGAAVVPYVNTMFGIQHDPATISQVVIGTFLGSGLPDIDHPKGTIGSMFPRLSEWINMRFDHRGYTHSFQAAGLVLIASIFLVLPLFLLWRINFFPLAIDIFVAALVHDFADCWNPAGVRLFGDHRIYHYHEDPGCAISVGSPEELRIRAAAMVFLIIEMGLIFFPLNKFTYYVNNRPENAMNIIKERMDRYEAIVDAQGVWKGSRIPLNKGNPVPVRIQFIDDRKSVAISIKGEPGIYVADVNEKDPAATITLSRIENIRFIPSAMVSRNLVVKEADLRMEMFPQECMISGTILTEMTDEVQKVFEAMRPADSIQGAQARNRQSGLVTYELKFFPISRLSELLPLYVEHANLRVFWRIPKRGN